MSLASPIVTTTEATSAGAELAPHAPVLSIKVGREWTPRPDPSWQRILTEIGGRNLYGDPMLRIVYGAARLELMGGIWDNAEEEDAGLPSVRYQWDQRYPWAEDYWLVEEWIPTTLSPEAWERQERKVEEGVTYLEHPIYPGRGRYVWYTRIRRKAGEEELPESPTPTVLRSLAQRWRRLRERTLPIELLLSADKREQIVRENLREAHRRKELRRTQTRKINRDILENEVGGIPSLEPRVSLAGLTVPGA